MRLTALAFRGLGETAARELRASGATVMATAPIRDYDLVSFRLRVDRLPDLRDLRCVEDVFLELGVLSRLRRTADLPALRRLVNKAAILEGLAAKNRFNASLGGRRGKVRHAGTFVCFVKQDKDRPLQRRQLAGTVEDAVARHFPRWRRADPAGLELWLFWRGSLSVGLRLTDKRFRYRGETPPARAAALRPTIAAAMAWLANPRAGETVVDPMCGSGTLLAEAYTRNPHTTYLGFDVDAEAVDLARARLAGKAEATVRDARRPWPDTPGSMDCVLCNLPWGGQFAVDDRLVRDVVRNCRRSMTPDGRMVLLTTQTAMLEAALRESGFKWRRAAQVWVRGRRAVIYTARAATPAAARSCT